MKRTLTSCSRLALLVTAMTACGDDGILLAEALLSGGGNGRPSDPVQPSPTDPAPAPSSPTEDAVEVLTRHCGDCHIAQDGEGLGFLSEIDDIDQMIADGRIVPGDRDESQIYVRMANDTMPPAFIRERPTEEEIELVGAFIDSLEPQISPEEAAVVEILTRHCGSCHIAERGEGSGGLSEIDDIDRMIEDGIIEPGDRDNSMLYVRMANDTMPPAFIRERPTEEEIELVGAFIDSL